MKKYIFLLLLLVLFPMAVKANHIGDFYQTINVSLNCDDCIDKSTKEIKLQLFANGEAVEDGIIVLKNGNDFEDAFEDLPMFEEDGVTEIEYEVKFFEDGEYKSFSKNDVSYEKEKISGWVSVSPKDIKPGNDYVLFTDNWYYEYNDRDSYILVDGDLYHQYVYAYPEYNLVNGKKSYFMLDDEPEDKTIWHFEKLSEDDELYEYYKDYWVLSNYNDLNLVLSGYMGDGYNSYFYKVSNNNGLADGKSYANRVAITPIEDELSRFKIHSNIYWSEDHLTTLYLGIGHFVEVKAQKEEDYAAHLIAFQYLDDVEVEHVYNMVINREICKSLEDYRRIALSDSFDVLGVFKDIDSLEGIDFDVLDPSVLKIVDGKIIPLKIGETDISFKYAFTAYTIHVSVYDIPNPNTRVGIIVLIVLTAIVSGILLIVFSRKKKANE